MDVQGYLSDQEHLKPVLCVVIYHGTSGAIATINKVSEPPKGQGVPVVGAGQCLTRQNLVELTARLSGGVQTRQILNKRVLVADQDLVAWYLPSHHRHIFFQTGRVEFDEEMDARRVLHPSLIFLARPAPKQQLGWSGLYVYAYKGKGRPDADTLLYRAPYYNLSANGHMCRGDVPMPDRAVPTLACIKEYEDAFFNSRFAHTSLGSRELTTYGGGHASLWRALAACGHGFFPEWSLVPMVKMGGQKQLTLRDAVNATV